MTKKYMLAPEVRKALKRARINRFNKNDTATILADVLTSAGKPTQPSTVYDVLTALEVLLREAVVRQDREVVLPIGKFYRSVVNERRVKLPGGKTVAAGTVGRLFLRPFSDSRIMLQPPSMTVSTKK